MFLFQRESRKKYYRWLAFGVSAVSIFSTVMDRGVTVALPAISEHFRADLPEVQWVLIIYLVVTASLLLPMGRMGDIVGLKKVNTAGLVVFAVGGLITALAPSMHILFAGRFFQGLGSAMVQGMSMAIAVDAFGEGQRGKAVGSVLVFVGLGNVLGPAVGGTIVEIFGWQSVFVLTAVISGFAALLSWMILKNDRPTNAVNRRYDWVGAALCIVVLTSLLGGFTSIPSSGWFSGQTVAFGACFAVFLACFAWRSLKVDEPILDFRLFSRLLFTTSITANFLCFLGMSSVWFLLPFYLEYVSGYSPDEVGLVFVPAALAMVIVSPISGRLSDRHGWRRFTIGGLVCAACGLILLSTLDMDSSTWLPYLAVIPISGGMGAFYGPNNSAILSVTEVDSYGSVLGFINLVRNSGNLVTIAVSTVIVSGVMRSMGYDPDLSNAGQFSDPGLLNAFVSGMRAAFATLAMFALLAAFLSIFKGGDSKVRI